MEGNQHAIHTYGDSEQITSTQQLPVPQADRTCTDLFCTIFTTLIAITIFVAAIILLDVEKLRLITYPTDGVGNTCTLDNPNYNYLYFTSLNDPTKRLCVAQCPTGTQTELNCLPNEKLACGANTNPQFQVQIYSSQPTETSLGLYCLPQDEALKKKVLQNAGLYERFTFVNAFRALWISLGISMGLGILYLIMMCCATAFMVYASISVGGLACILVGIFLLIQKSTFFTQESGLILIFSIILMMFGVFCLYSLIFHQKDIAMCISYIQKGNSVLGVEQGLFLLIPVYLVFLLGLLCLFGFQTFAIWSKSDMIFHESSVYYQPEGTFAFVGIALNLVELIWGLCFLKQTFNFLVSGCAVTWYFWNDSRFLFGLTNLFRFHWGSCVAGSFILNFFYLFDVLYDAIKPDDKDNSRFSKMWGKVCCCCDRFLGLSRGQAHAFINIVGLPFCNSARWCERLNFLANFFKGSQSLFRFFRVGSHVMMASLATLFSFFYTIQDGSANAPALLFSFMINMFTVTFFVCMVTDLAETIFLCDLVKRYLQGEGMEEVEDYDEVADKNLQESNVNQGYDIYPTSGK